MCVTEKLDNFFFFYVAVCTVVYSIISVMRLVVFQEFLGKETLQNLPKNVTPSINDVQILARSSREDLCVKRNAKLFYSAQEAIQVDRVLDDLSKLGYVVKYREPETSPRPKVWLLSDRVILEFSPTV